ncbi:pyridoxamine 5'-phosphate oxidase [Gaoshiqia sp. Z1-71]|uniref:pyridoxamine 5'-phosphate oxidase n=1 Tax=Gaoshiqia hydrogeniformans TaxID=3290090 RepID=UPI003BF82F4D
MLRDIRTNYRQFKLDEKDLTKHPFQLFQQWLNEAIGQKLDEPTAMTLSTSVDNQPDSRIVLLKELNQNGFVFFTNYNSEKGRQLDHNQQVALNFFWAKLERQVRVKGAIHKLSEDLSAAYFRSRPRESQLGAWASDQSAEISNRQELEEKFSFFSEKFKDQEIEKPDYWGGYLVLPAEIEFWQGRPNRLHDRFRYYLTNGLWKVKRLSP